MNVVTGQSARLRWILLDRYRLIRSLAVGVLISLPLAFLITPREALAIGMLGALGVDVCLVCRAAWRMDEHQTQHFFPHFGKRLIIWWNAQLV